MGVVSLILFGAFLYFRTAKKLEEAVLYERNDLLNFCSEKLGLKRSVKIFSSDRIDTPFVHGLINPRIMLPSRLIIESSEQDLKYIIMHELVHIKRFDYIIKLISMLVLCIYWFNPVIWLCYILSQKDMEMSCDDKVITVFEEDIRKEYASVLISLAERQNSILGSGFPAFGESNVKSRVKGIVNYKKPGIWIGLISTIVLVVFITVLLTDGYSEMRQNNGKPVYKQETISFEEYEALKKGVLNYYIEYEPDTVEKLNITIEEYSNLNIITEVKKYGDGYLVLAEKYDREAQDWSFPNLMLIDDEFIIKSVSVGLTTVLPYFGIYSTVDEDKQIACGIIKGEMKTSGIEIRFDDGTVVRDSISEKGGYIVVADTLSDIKDIELYSSKGKVQDLIKANPLSKKSYFAEVAQEEEYRDNYLLETVVINNCVAKDGPGDHFESIGAYKYGDIVYVTAKYNGWAKCSEYRGEESSYKWIRESNLIDEKNHYRDNYGIVTADEVIVGEIAAQKGNLLRVLIREENRSCVSIIHIDAHKGKTGWIDNNAYSLPEPGIYFNQGILKSGTYAYSEPSITSEMHVVDYVSFVSIVEEKGEWAYFETYGPIGGWVLKENIYIPPNIMGKEEKEAYKVVREYFDALEESDFKRMAVLSTEYHKNNYIQNNGLREIEGTEARMIIVCTMGEPESELNFDVSIIKKGANVLDHSFLYYTVTLIKEEDGVWRVDRLEYERKV